MTQLMDLLEASPGLTMGQVGKEFGIHHAAFLNAVRALEEQGQIRKDESGRLWPVD